MGVCSYSDVEGDLVFAELSKGFMQSCRIVSVIVL